MKAKADTKTRILKEAYREFQKNGYKQADINTIVKKAGVTKGALYYYFCSKEELANTVIEREIVARVDRKFLQYLKPGNGLSIQESLGRMAERLTDEEAEYGTIFMKFANEIPGRQKGTHTKVRKVVEMVVNGLVAKLQDDQRQRLLSPAINTERMAQLLCAATLGSLTMSKTYQDRSVFTNVIEQLNVLIGAVHA